MNITGALIGFRGTPSTVNITNNLCPTATGCITIGGLRVQLNDTPYFNASINNPITGSGTVTLLTPSTAHLSVRGSPAAA